MWSGQAPVVAFTVHDKNGNPVALSALGAIQFTMAGPTTDYGYTSFGTDTSSTPGYVTENPAKATCDGAGNCTYQFAHSVPAKATGTYAIGVEARRTENLLAGTTKQQRVTYGAPNKVAYFSVDGSVVTPRRTVVAVSNCNQCHVNLSVHGSLRNNTEYCHVPQPVKYGCFGSCLRTGTIRQERPAARHRLPLAGPSRP